MLVQIRGKSRHVGLGWKPGRGTNPQAFRVVAVLPAKVLEVSKMWWANGWWGDQGLQDYSKSECTIFSWLHAIHDGPVTPRKQKKNVHIIKPILDPDTAYRRGQELDGTDPSDRESGLTCDSAAKVMRENGLIGEYRWAETVDEVTKWVSMTGPALIGANWYYDDFDLAPDGKLRMTGGVAGGHQTCIDAVDFVNELLWIKNSWNRTWGHSRSLHPSGGVKRGFYAMTFKQLDQHLHNEGAEVCTYRELPTRERIAA